MELDSVLCNSLISLYSKSGAEEVFKSMDNFGVHYSVQCGVHLMYIAVYAPVYMVYASVYIYTYVYTLVYTLMYTVYTSVYVYT